MEGTRTQVDQIALSDLTRRSSQTESALGAASSKSSALSQLWSPCLNTTITATSGMMLHKSAAPGLKVLHQRGRRWHHAVRRVTMTQLRA
jgi:hypothetical protein